MPFAQDCLDTIGLPPNRLYRIEVNQCTTSSKRLQLIEPGTGEVLDLTQYHIGNSSADSSSSAEGSLSSCWCGVPSEIDGIPKHGVELVIKEMSNSCQYRAKMCEVRSEEDAQLGIVYIPVDHILSEFAGVWLAMAIVWEEGFAKRHFPFYFDVLPNLSIFNPSGPLTFYEIRMAVRDVGPEMNFLLDTVEFKEEEIAWAMRRPIDYWNEIPPPVRTFTPITFPYRYHWLNATVGELLKMVAIWLRRNDLDYSAGGLTVGDTKKWPDYYKLGDEMVKEYKDFVKAKKVEINIEGAYAELGGYRWTPYR